MSSNTSTARFGSTTRSQSRAGTLPPRGRVEPQSQGRSSAQVDSRSRVPVQDPVVAHVQQLEAALLRTQSELGSLRNQLQPWETIIPAQVIGDFRQINKRVKEVCRTISDSVLDQKFADVTEPTTLHMAEANLKRFADAIRGCEGIPSLVNPSNGQGSRPLEDVVEYGLRAIVNRYLNQFIFVPFHPSLRSKVSEELWDIYRQMRQQKSQLVSGMWRANAFSTLNRDMKPREIEDLTSDFLDRLSDQLGLLKSISDPGDDFVLSKDERQQLEEIFHLACQWNARVKSEAVFTDFHPVRVRNDETFDSSTMVPYDGMEVPKLSPRILCAVTLGLQSSEVSKEGEGPSYEWQEKVQVLTEEYFADSEAKAVHGNASVPAKTNEGKGKGQGESDKSRYKDVPKPSGTSQSWTTQPRTAPISFKER